MRRMWREDHRPLQANERPARVLLPMPRGEEKGGVLTLKLEASLYACLQILSASLFEKTQISCALQPYLDSSDQLSHVNQLMLFDF